MAKRILVTGVTGFIGSHLVKELVKRKYDVHGIVKPATNRNPVLINDFLEGAKLMSCDITDYYAVRNTLRKADPEVVVHLAALSPVRESFEKPFSFVNTNIIGTFNMAYALMELKDFKRRRLIYASTAEVYGIQNKPPVKEDAALNPSSPYANTKVVTDMQIRMMSYVYGLDATVMRCTNSYGRKIDTGFFVEYVITAMLKGEKVYIGAPDSLRDYMYISDHVNAYIKAIESKKAKGEAFNIATGYTISNKEAAYKIADMLGYDKKKIVLGRYPPDYPLRPLESDQPFIDLDSSKARKILGWKPEVSLDVGLKMTIDFWKRKIRG